MYPGGWRAEARRVIQKIHESLPEGADLRDRAKALSRAAHDYHGGTSWGRKVWGSERRAYLARHGAQFTPSPMNKKQLQLYAGLASGDIVLAGNAP